MNIIPLPVEQTPSLFAADHTPSDDELQQQILGEQRDALRAKNAHNYTRAKMLAEAARSNCRSMYSRWLTLYHGRGQHRQNIIMISYVQCTDALCNAIESHELGHTLKLAAQAAAQDDANASHNFQEITAIFHGVTSSQHGRPQLQKMLDPTIWLMVTGLAVPCADALMLEAIAHYEQYHLHANEFDMSLVHMRPTYTLQGWPTTQTGLLQMSTDSDAWSNEQPHYALFIGDKRSDAIDTHRLRVHDMSIKQKQAYNNALRERLSLVSNEFTPTQLAHFVSNCNLQGTDYDKSDRAIILTALQSVLHSITHTLFGGQARLGTPKHRAMCQKCGLGHTSIASGSALCLRTKPRVTGVDAVCRKDVHDENVVAAQRRTRVCTGNAKRGTRSSRCG